MTALIAANDPSEQLGGPYYETGVLWAGPLVVGGSNPVATAMRSQFLTARAAADPAQVPAVTVTRAVPVGGGSPAAPARRRRGSRR